MKKIDFLFFPIILLFGVFAANAQSNNPNDTTYHPLVQEGKVWSEVLVSGSVMYGLHFTTTKMALFGDTIISDVLYKKMYVSKNENPEFPQDWTLQNFMREDEDKKVWYKKNATSEEKLYYDFSLEVGDTVPKEIEHYGQHNVIVEDISYITMKNGEEYKVWHLSSFANEFPNDKEFWIEGIGSRIGVLNALTGYFVGGYYRLLCVHENDKLIYNDNPWGGVCYKTGSSGINTYENQVNIFPNPAKDRLHIEIKESLNIHAISLINIQGQIIRCYEPTTTQFDVSGIAEGIYFIILSSSEGDIVKKVLIEK